MIEVDDATTTHGEMLSRDHGRPRASLARVSTVAALSAALSTRILDGEFPPGVQLREANLVAEYGVARQSVRAALHSLSQTGLLTHLPNRGVFVSEIGQSDFEDIFVLRSAIEIEAVTYLARSGKVSDDVRATLARLAELPRNARWSQVIAMDLEFHYSVVRSTGSQRLSDGFAGLMQELQLCLIPLQRGRLPSQWLTESHAVILEVIENGDPLAAADEIRQHLAASKRQIEEINGWSS